MEFVADLHVHTISSGHAYSTITEIARAAADKGLLIVAITDHGSAMPGAPHAYHFGNLDVVPRELSGVRILRGIEANILDLNGTLDLDEGRLARLDIVLAGLHTLCAPHGSVEENTAMIVNAMKNRWVDGITHPGNPEYPVDFETVVRAAVEYDVALEINNSSLTVSRAGSRPNCEAIARLIKRYGAKLIVSSDSHFADTVGVFTEAVELLKASGISAEEIINTSVKRIESHLMRRR